MKTLRQRKQIRLQGYDYSQEGRYFITICTKNREFLFGEIMNRTMFYNETGKIAENELLNISSHYENVDIERFVIMPNHVHMIVVIKKRVDSAERINPFPTRKADIPNIIGKYKAGVTRAVGNAFMRSGVRSENCRTHSVIVIWQSRYHDHIIRGKKSYQKIYEYVGNNPAQWEADMHNPANPRYNDWNEESCK